VIKDEATGGTDVGTHGKTLLDARPTAATVLAGVRWIDRVHSLAGPYCLAGEDTEEVAPSGIVNTLVEAGLAAGSIVFVPTVAIGDRGGPAAQIGGLHRLDISIESTSYWRTRASAVL
jgi:hypothetical protein